MDALNALMFSLMLWISAASGMDMPTDLPTVEFRSDLALQCLSMDISDAECTIEATAGQMNTAAMYFDNTIYLPKDVELASLKGTLGLLHELVHHMQYTNGETSYCIALDERMAYLIELQWLQAMGYDAWKVFEEVADLTPMTVFFLTRCTNGEF